MTAKSRQCKTYGRSQNGMSPLHTHTSYKQQAIKRTWPIANHHCPIPTNKSSSTLSIAPSIPTHFHGSMGCGFIWSSSLYYVIPHSTKSANANDTNCTPPLQPPSTSSTDGYHLDQNKSPQILPNNLSSPFLLAPIKFYKLWLFRKTF